MIRWARFAHPKAAVRDLAAAVRLVVERLARTPLIVLIIGLALATIVRLPLLSFKSVDYYNERVQAYPAIRDQGFTALSSSSSNYNPPYFYALYIVARLLPGLPEVVAVKLPAMLADVLCALLIYLIVKLKYHSGMAAVWAALAVLFAPTVIANSAFWGQVDSIHTAALLACVYFLLRRQNTLAVLAFAIALSIKLQAIFIAPLLLALFLRGTLSWKPFLLVPAVLLAALVPAWLAGRPLADLLGIYLHQATQFEFLTMNAASAYQWAPTAKEFFYLLYWPGLLMAASMVFLLIVVIYRSPAVITPPLILELALLTLLVVPFFLPKMHDRYFFPADVLSIAFALYYPQLFYVPIAIIGASSLSYVPFLFNVDVVPLPVLTLVILAVICILAFHSIRGLYGPAAPGPQPAAEPGIPGSAQQNGESA